MKKFLLVLFAGITLSGCATGQGYYTPVTPLGGAIIGGAIGNAISTGNRGAATVAGAVLGAAIGTDIQARNNPHYYYHHHNRYYYAPPPPVVYNWSSCRPAAQCSMFYYPHEREACLRGIHECRSNESRLHLQQSIDAYNFGRQ